MDDFGQYLRELRRGADRSARWVERQSKLLYPHQPVHHISHSYLRQIEEGDRGRPRRAKIRSLARIYGVDEAGLLRKAGFAAEPSEDTAGVTGAADPALLADLEEMVSHLKTHGLNPAYFIRGVTRLSDEALGVVARLISTLSVRETRGTESRSDRKARRV